ncbi:MAG: c-type cytochrome [Gemmobacter sp.]
MRWRMGMAMGLALLAGPLAAGDAGEDVDRGAELYMHHCAMCHGIDAAGRGPLSPVLTIQPTDLTALAAGNDGVFPTARVVARIDGRDPLVAHGSPMPVYGQLFEGKDVVSKTPEGQPIFTSLPILDLLVWLETIQR